MTEEAKDETPEPTHEEQLLEAVSYAVPDLRLQVLIGLVEASDAKTVGVDTPIQIPMTLNIPGGIVTGTLVSYRVWIEESAEQFVRLVRAGAGSAADARETDDSLQKSMRKLLGIKTVETKPDALAELPDHERRFINLIGARVSMHNGFVPTAEGVPWRGRLTDVAGWILGELSVD